MNYGKRSSIPKWKYKELAMSCDQSEEKFHCKRSARNLSEKKRRDQFNVLILELCSMVSTSRTRKMDKSAVLKATINFLKTHNEMALRSEENAIKENWKPSFLSDDEFSQLMLEALDGFMIVFSQQGHILYTSDSIISLLRHLPKELKSSTIYELVHEDDRPEIFKILMEADAKKNELELLKNKRYNFECRMRKGSLENTEKVQYEAVRFNGSFSFIEKSDVNVQDGDKEEQCCFVATVRLQHSQLTREMTLLNEKEKEFTSRHSLDWKFLFLDHRGPPVLGYLPFEVLGTSVYDYCHQDDLDKLTQCHEALMQTGEGTSCYYRYLTKGQEWIWLQTRYFITYNQWNSKPEFIMCTHRVVSYAEVRKNYNKMVSLMDDPSMRLDLSKGYSSNDSMSEMSFSLKDTSSEGSYKPVSVQQTIVSEKVYEPSQDNSKTGSVSDQDSNSGSGSGIICDNRLGLHDSGSTMLGALSSSSVGSDLNAVGNLEPPYLSSENKLPDRNKNLMISDQMAVIQLKLQTQLVARHQKLQDDILKQQEELRHVQQQLLNAQQLMFQQQSPFIGMAGGPGSTAEHSQKQVAENPWNTMMGQMQEQIQVPETNLNPSLHKSLSPTPLHNQQNLSMSPPTYTSTQIQSAQTQYQASPSSMDGGKSPSSSQNMRMLASDRLAFPEIIDSIRSPSSVSLRPGNTLQQTVPFQPSANLQLPQQEQDMPLVSSGSTFNNHVLSLAGTSMLDSDGTSFFLQQQHQQDSSLGLYEELGIDPNMYFGSIE